MFAKATKMAFKQQWWHGNLSKNIMFNNYNSPRAYLLCCYWEWVDRTNRLKDQVEFLMNGNLWFFYQAFARAWTHFTSDLALPIFYLVRRYNKYLPILPGYYSLRSSNFFVFLPSFPVKGIFMSTLILIYFPWNDT